MQAVYKKDNKRYEIYDINYKKSSGFPLFLIYKDGQWLSASAKHFIPVTENDLNNTQNINIDTNCKKTTKRKTCFNCKYRHVDKIYDPYSESEVVVYAWCDKDRDLMDTTVGNNKFYLQECEMFEENTEE